MATFRRSILNLRSWLLLVGAGVCLAVMQPGVDARDRSEARRSGSERARDLKAQPRQTIAPGFASTAPIGQWLKGDAHVHDDHSSDGSGTRQGTDQRGPGNVSIFDQIGQGVQNGLDWMPLTDHRTYDQHYDPLWESSELLLTPGEEANGSPHATVFGAVDMIVQGGDTPGRPGFARLQTSIWDAHSQGAAWSHAHPDDGHLNEDGTVNDRANAIGADATEAWNGLTTGIEPKLNYAENRWNAGYRFGIVGASDSHFRELWTVAGPGLPVTHAFAPQPNERGILQGLQAGRTLISARATGASLATLEADFQGDQIYEAIAGDEVVAPAGTEGTLRIRVQLGMGSTVSLFKSPGKSAGALQTFVPMLPDQTFTANITATDAQTWYYVEVRGQADPDPMRVLTSPIFVGPALATPQPAMPVPPDAGVEDGAQLILGDAGRFNGFPDVAVNEGVTHVVAEQHSPGRTAVIYRRMVGSGALSTAVDLAPASAAARFPKVVARGNDVWVAWQDERAGQIPRRPAIYLRRSLDGGSTWQPEVNLRQIEGRAEKPDLALTSNGQPVIVWQEISANNPFDVMAQIIGTDVSPVNLSRAGKTIVPANPADTRSSRYPASVWPVVTVRADGLIAAGFQDNRTDPEPLWTGRIFTGEEDATEVDNWQILVTTRPGDAGGWSAPVQIGNDERADRHPALAFTAEGALVVAWDSKTLNASGANLSIRFSVSADDGASFSDAANPGAVAENTTVMSQYPKLSADASGEVRAVWYDTRATDWRWRVMTAAFRAGAWNGTLLMARGVNTWPAIDRGKIAFASTRNATRMQRDRTQQIFVSNVASLEAVSAVSRKVHGTSSIFDLPLPLRGGPGIECRSGLMTGAHQVLISFASAVAIPAGGVTLEAPKGGIVSGFSINGSVVTVNLTDVANAQTITIKLADVSEGTLLGDVSVPVGILLGDVNSSRRVDAGDVLLVRQRSLEDASLQNFRADVNTSGRIDAGDVLVVRTQSLNSLP